MITKDLLVIDDYERMEKNIKTIFQDLDLAIEFAAEEFTAFRKLEEAAFKIIAIDYFLPGKTGPEFIREAIEKGLVNQSTVFILLSSEPDFHVVVKDNPYFYIPKPIIKSYFRYAVTRILHGDLDI